MSLFAEQNVIGALITDPECLSQVYDRLQPEMFTDGIMGLAYVEFLRGYDNEYTVNLVVLGERLMGSGYPRDIVMRELKECVAAMSVSAQIGSYADMMIAEYRSRELGRILQSVRPDAAAVNQQIGQLMQQLEALQEGGKASSKPLSDIARENECLYFCERAQGKLNLGFPKLDDLLGGLEGGDVIVIGARPAVGKSAFVTQIASSLSKQGKRIGFYNLEMQEKQVYERFLVAQSGISLTRLRRAVRFLGDEKERFLQANEALKKQDNIVISTGSKTVSEIRHESRHMGYDVIIIDYLQLLRSDVTYRGNRYAEVGAISKAVKALAMELNVPIIALSQLNRLSEVRENKEPTMAELREAGDIEQDASVIMLLWNLSQENRSRKGCKIEKQRQGGTGKVVLEFNGDLMRFEESEQSVKEAQKWADQEDDDCPFT